ncbi:uncharacterized protein LOC128173907 [Crassostrea angulata]|uniref:uncharacterized protein LOC128173907 n=1 Tax=Magallana angulata TaxID=2784310 RepID=UPI0022B0C223|nr:uncharacterized protein LOC128173907 [Crassostrea angulata]
MDFFERHAPGILRRDLLVGDRRHLSFFTERQLDLLAEAKTWCMDGTFRCVNHPWKQMFSIHGFVKSGQHIKQGFVADFEAALWKALKDRFPGTPIQGCVFHWTQAVFRKVQDHGRQVQYVSNWFLAIWYGNAVVHGCLQDVDSFFKIHHWSVFMTSIRANNDVEGWYNRLNTSVATKGSVPFYHLLVLHREATNITVQMKMVSESADEDGN